MSAAHFRRKKRFTKSQIAAFSRPKQNSMPYSLVYLIYPKFEGGTKFAVQREIDAISQVTPVHCVTYSSSFNHQAPSHRYHNTNYLQTSRVIACKNLLIHNPLPILAGRPNLPKMHADRVWVVLHDNAFTHSGLKKYDLDRIPEALSTSIKFNSIRICPISRISRGLNRCKLPVIPFDWHNIIDLPVQLKRVTKENIRDSRGRHSRPHRHLFPRASRMLEQFPRSSPGKIIGGEPVARIYKGSKVRVLPFIKGLSLSQLNFNYYVYDHSPVFRETFGRKIFEAIYQQIVVFAPSYLKAVFPGILPIEDLSLLGDASLSRQWYQDQIAKQIDDLDPYTEDSFMSRVAEALCL